MQARCLANREKAEKPVADQTDQVSENITNPAPAQPAPEPAAPSAPAETAPAAQPAGEGAQTAAEEAPAQPAPRRRGRPRKRPAEGEEAPAEERPRRRGRPRKADAAPSEEAAPLTAEVMQARALAQISQAAVVRAERRAEEERAALLEGAELPAPRRRGRPRKTAAPAQADAAQLSFDVASAPVSAPAEGASDAAPAPAEETPRPQRRRGRKSKAQLAAEAEERARAAAEAAGAALAGDLPAEGAPAPAQDAPAPASAEAPEAPEAAKPARRRGRPRKNAKEATEAASADTAADESEAAEAHAVADKRDKHTRAEKRDRAAKGAEANEGQQREGRRSHTQRRDERSAGQNRDNRGKNDQRNLRNQNRQGKRNRYNMPTEPTLSRDECAAMKVAELRERGAELGLEVAGVKKAELVDLVYEAAARAEGFREVAGILEIGNEGFGHLRVKGYLPSRDDIFVSANLVRAAGLRPGDYVTGTSRPARPGDKYPGLAKIESVNGADPDAARHRPKFSELTPIFPNERLRMEHGRDSITGRAIDIVSPIGKGQRGLIVSPPKAGKTTVLKHICQSIAANNPEVHLICLLVDERPEEVTDMQRSIKGEVVASTFDMPADNHTRVSELVIEHAKRLVEMGGDVVVVLDSITRLARAYNLAAPASGRILSGGVDSAALYPPKKFLGAARNIENGGSLTILASALVETGSKMDEVIFEEFKGTGNMELKLDRDLADRRVFPAIDPVASGTRNEDLLIEENMRPFVWGIRRVLANMNNTERAAAAFIKGLKSTNTNEEFLIRSAKRAADRPEML